jgi:predicted RND superfamily exporter protein
MQRFFLHFAAALRRHRVLTLLLFLGLTLVSGVYALQSRVDNSLSVWQSADDPHWQQYQDFVARYRIIDPLIVYLPGLDLLSQDEIADALQAQTSADRLHSLAIHSLSGQEVGLFFVVPKPDSSPAALATLLAEVESVLQEHQVPYHLGGVWYLTTLLDQLSAKSTQTLFPVVLAILAVGVIILVRSWRNVVLVLLCGCLPALQITGVMALCGVKLNMILLALPPCTMILGIAHAIHLVSKEPDPDHPDGLSLFAEVAPPSLLSGLTIMIGFFSLYFSSYLPIQQLGLWGTVAGALSLATSLIVLGLFFEPAPCRAVPLPQGYVAFMARHRLPLAGLFLVLIVLSGVGISRLQTGSLILDFFQETAQVRDHYQQIENGGLGLTPFEIDLADSQLSNEALRAVLAEYAGNNPEITQVLYTFGDGTVISEATEHGARFPALLSLDTMDQRPQRATVLLRTVASEPTLALAEELETLLQQRIGPQPHPYVTGSVPLYCRGQQQLFTSLLTSFASAFVPISLVMGLALRSWYFAILAIIPNILPVVFILALMGWLSIPLSVATVTVASIVFGIVVDDTIHFLHRLQAATRESGSAVTHLHDTIHYAGPAMLTAAVISGTGFLGFLASPFIPLRHFGLLISGALWLAIFCDMMLLPLLLLSWKRS